MKLTRDFFSLGLLVFVTAISAPAIAQTSIPADSVRTHYQRNRADYAGWTIYDWTGALHPSPLQNNCNLYAAIPRMGNGGNADWLPANKPGFGASYTTASNVWFTLEGGWLSEVYYPRIDTPSVRNLDFIVTDGQSFAVRAQNASTSLTRLVHPDHGRREGHQGRRKDEDDAYSLTLSVESVR